MSFEVIFWANFDFEIFFSVVIFAEGLTIDASTVEPYQDIKTWR